MAIKTFTSQGFVFNVSLDSEPQIIPESGDEIEHLVWMVEVCTPGGNTNTVKAQDFIDHGWNFLSPEFRGHLDHWSHIKDGVFAEFCSQFKTWLDTKWEKYKPGSTEYETRTIDSQFNVGWINRDRDIDPDLKLKANETEAQSIKNGEWKFSVEVNPHFQTVKITSPAGSEETVNLVALLLRGKKVLEDIELSGYPEIDDAIASFRQKVIKKGFLKQYPQPLKATIQCLREEEERRTQKLFNEVVEGMYGTLNSSPPTLKALEGKETKLGLIAEILLNSDISESTRAFLQQYVEKLKG